MEFKDFMIDFTEHSKKVFASSENLFVVNVDKDKMWETYIEAFPPEKNKIFRTRREYDCSCCKNFIRHFANVVSIVDNKLVTFWDFSTGDDTFEPVLRAMESLIKNASVQDGFVTKDKIFGTQLTREIIENQIYSWGHFYIDIPKIFVENDTRLSIPEIKSSKRDIRNVFKRSLDEITKDSVQTVLDMIEEGQLYRGEEWKGALEKFQSLQKSYLKLKTDKEKDNFAWVEGFRVGGAVGKIRNHSIGTLLVDISNGVDIEEAVRKYEVIVAPNNYKRPKPIFTQKMIEDAKKTLIHLGLENSLGRRHAKLSDVTINNVLWANRNAKKVMKEKSLDVFESLKEDNEKISSKGFEKLRGVSIEKFLEDLQSYKKIEILFENRHEGNLVSLIAPENSEAPSLFKWDNGFSWSYNGNMTDSLKQRVKSAGGNIEGVLRFSLQWNDGEYNPNDFDAHCVEPNGNHIYFPSANRKHSSTGVLDVDIRTPSKGNVAVENISWSNLDRMPNGKYKFFVHNYSHRGGKSGFYAEVEFNGEIHEFTYKKELRSGENVEVAEVVKTKDGFSITNKIPSSVSQKEVWGIKTNQFMNTSVFMYSPNHWDDKGVGNRHYFFMIDGCLNKTSPNGFYNEYLKEDFTKHRKVFEALGGKMKVEDSDIQLSGLGFSSTKQDYVILKVDGKIVKVIF